MADRATTIAGEIVTAIAAATLSQDLSVSLEKPPEGWTSSATVVRAYLAEYALSDLDYTRCTVIPATWDSDTASRSARQEVYGIDVILQGKPDNLSEKDGLMQLAQEINELLEHTKLSTSGASWVRVERTPLFDPEQINQSQMFVSASRHSFLIIRNVT